MEERIPRGFLLSVVFVTIDLALLFILAVVLHYIEIKVATWNDAIYSGGKLVGARLLFFQGPLQFLFLTFIYARQEPPSLLLTIATVAMSLFIMGMMITGWNLIETLRDFMPDFSSIRQPLAFSVLLTSTAAWFSVKRLTKRQTA